MTVTHDQLRAVLWYDPIIGVFLWKSASRNNRVGDFAGYSKGKYAQIGIAGKLYAAHRLAFFYMTGKWPTDDVDHINGNRQDNRWSNLRPATRSENNQNMGPRSDNSSGYRGVWWNAPRGKWSAMITSLRKRTFLGNFETPELAYAAYCTAKSRIHEFQPTVRN